MYNMYAQPTSLIQVYGRAGAEAYPMAPNSRAALFDANSDIFYLKESDGAGFSTIKPYKFEPYVEQPKPTIDYATKEDIENLKGMIEDVKQLIPKSRNSKSSTE